MFSSCFVKHGLINFFAHRVFIQVENVHSIVLLDGYMRCLYPSKARAKPFKMLTSSPNTHVNGCVI